MKVAWIHVAPVKGLAIEERDQIVLGPNGVEDDRRFVLVDEAGRMLNGKRLAGIATVHARFDPATRRLELQMSDGTRVAGIVELTERVAVAISGCEAFGHLVEGPWAAALTKQLGAHIRLVRLDVGGTGQDRARDGAGATLLSLGSLERLAAEGNLGGPIDPRRFRMLIGVSGAAPHAEDEWIGRPVLIGAAVVVPAGNVGRCVVTTRRPGSAESDLDTLGLLARYRREVPSTEPLSFGVWARVDREGLVRIGDDIRVLS
jgi:uncharacterized protein YcbX